MKDVIMIILFYLIWNSPIHQAHPTLIPVLLTVYVICIIIEIIAAILE
jgi:hypothetical protein